MAFADGWKERAAELASESFPLGMIVQYQRVFSTRFGRVERITPQGRIYVLPGEFHLLSETYAGSYMSRVYDPRTFSAKDDAILRFMPHLNLQENGLLWMTSERNYCAILEKLNLQKGYVHTSDFIY